MGKILLNVANLQGDTSDSLLKHLEEHSELLQQQTSEFGLISQSFDIKFAYETKPTPLAGAIATEVNVLHLIRMLVLWIVADLTIGRLCPNGLQ